MAVSSASASVPELSVLLPTVRPWPEARRALDSLLAQEGAVSYEVLLLDGHGAGLDRDADPRVRLLRAAGSDGFSLRALGIAEARGGIVAISEDHCIVPPDWCATIVEAHRASDAAALVAPIRNHPESATRAVDRANFLLTMGAYAPPLDRLVDERLPVPTNLSLKRASLPDRQLEPGELEYGIIDAMKRDGTLRATGAPVLAHRQNWGGGEAVAVHFHSGRSYGAATRGLPPRYRLHWFGGLPLVPSRLWRATAPALARGAGGAPPSVADRLWLLALILANLAGQFAGAIAGAGASRRRLV